jgi:hypothetical protein
MQTWSVEATYSGLSLDFNETIPSSFLCDDKKGLNLRILMSRRLAAICWTK